MKMCNLKTFLLGGSGSAPGFPCCIEGVNDASLAVTVTVTGDQAAGRGAPGCFRSGLSASAFSF